MAKLLDILNNILYKGANINNAPSHFDDKQKQAFDEASKKLHELGTEANNVAKSIDFYNQKLIDSKKAYSTASNSLDKHLAQESAKNAQSRITSLENQHLVLENKIGKIVDKLGKKFNLSGKQLTELETHIRTNADELGDAVTKTKSSMGMLSSVVKGEFDVILGTTKKFFEEIGIIGLAIATAIHQMEELNRKMIEFNRRMGQGFVSNNLGMDLYGNSKQSSLSSIAMKNNIGEQEFLETFAGIAKGNVLGNTNDFLHQQDNMQKFGVQAAQLSKFYGVQMGTINTITANLVYNFGAKIKDLNGVFERGKEVALSAGVAVSDYFEKLKEATDDLGAHYVAGGIKGREELAAYAAKTNQSIASIMRQQDQFKDFTSQYEIQNRAAALNLNSYAKNIPQIWGKGYIGDVKGSNTIANASLAQDVINMGAVDKNNMINPTGLRVLHQAGFDKEQIDTVQRLVRLQNELDVSMKEYLDVEHQTADIRYKINKFDSENLTIGEKLRTMWGKISEAVIDPLKKVLSPVFDGLLNLASIVVNVVTPVLKVLTYPIALFGRGLSWIGDKLNWLYYHAIEPFSSKIGKIVNGINPLVDSFGKLAKAVWFMVGAFMTARIALLVASRGGGLIGNVIGSAGKFLPGNLGRYAAVYGRGIGRWAQGIRTGGMGGLWQGVKAAPGNLWQAGKGLIGRAAGGETAAAFRTVTMGGTGMKLMRGLKGGLIGAGLGLIGDAAGGKEGAALSTISNYAGIGAMLGSIIPGLGTALGGAIGGVIGVGVASWNKIKDVWSDGSKGFFEKIGDTFVAISDTIWDAFKGIFKGIKNMFSSLWEWLFGKEEKKEDFENNKAALAAGNFIDTSKAIQNVVEQRRIEKPYTAQEAQEKRMQKEFKPTVNVHVTNSFDGSSRVAAIHNR